MIAFAGVTYYLVRSSVDAVYDERFEMLRTQVASGLSVLGYYNENYKMVIWPVSSLRIAIRAQEILYRELAEHGTTAGLIENMQTRAQLYDLIDLKGYEALDSSIIASRLPS